MKRVLLLFAFLGCCAGHGHTAFIESYGVHESSYTSTNETKLIPMTLPGTVLIGVVASTGTGSISIYDSSGTATNPVAVLKNTGGQGTFCATFEIKISSGLTYATSGNGGTTFIFRRR